MITITEKNSGTLLKEFPLEQMEWAYKACEEYESYGITVELNIPSSAESLLVALNQTPKFIDPECAASAMENLDEKILILRDELKKELDDHD